jgi:GxxExxY protein
MNTDWCHERKDPLTGAILGAAFEVSNVLGFGFLESVYQRALAHELLARGRPTNITQ